MELRKKGTRKQSFLCGRLSIASRGMGMLLAVCLALFLIKGAIEPCSSMRHTHSPHGYFSGRHSECPGRIRECESKDTFHNKEGKLIGSRNSGFLLYNPEQKFPFFGTMKVNFLVVRSQWSSTYFVGCYAVIDFFRLRKFLRIWPKKEKKWKGGFNGCFENCQVL